MLLRRLLDGETVTHDGPVYPMKDALVAPRPVQARLPILIGGSGPKKTLRTLARYGDQWNAHGPAGRSSRERDAILREHCAAIGRDQRGDRAHDHRRPRHPRLARRRAGRLPGPPRRRSARSSTRPGTRLPRDAGARSPTASGRILELGFRHLLVDHAGALRPRDDRPDRRGPRAAERVTGSARSSRSPGGVGGREAGRGAPGARRRPAGRHRQHRRRLRRATACS